MFSIKAAAILLVAALENVSGVPMAYLDRIDDPETFWVRTAAILCQKTGDDFCEEDVRFMTENTELSGFSQIIDYKVGDTSKRVCAILPPVDDIDPSYVAESITGSFGIESEYPTSESTAAWLYLYHAAHCLDENYTTGNAENRAEAFATLGLTLLQGDPLFTPGVHEGQSRRIATMIHNDSAYWAAGTGERILFDDWKAQTANILRTQYGCNAQVVASTTIDTMNIQRDQHLGDGNDCQPVVGAGVNAGTVSDANLWIWMYGNGGLGAPPVAYTPIEMFSGDYGAAASYIMRTAATLAP